MSSFAPKAGCPMCGIVSQAQRSTTPLDTPLSPSTPTGAPAHEILWRDADFTAYREKTNPVSSRAHVVLAFNLHVPSIYTLSSSDLPLLVRLRDLATRLLTSFQPSSSPLLRASTPTGTAPLPIARPAHFCIGFISPPFYDPKIPVSDHLHAHAYILPADKLGWFRALAYSGLAWYDIDDLVAEIRESVSNNRVKSGYRNRKHAPIDRVPDAGARAGTAAGREISDPSIAAAPLSDPEQGLSPPASPSRIPLPPGSPSSPRSPLVARQQSPFAADSIRNGAYAPANTSSANLLSPPPTGEIPHLQV